jgi:AraC-like DNA-binding protein
MNENTDFVQRLCRSNMFTEFKEAFCTGLDLPLTLRPLEFWQLAQSGQPHENPLYAVVTKTNRGCAEYLETEQRAVDAAKEEPATVTCFAGLCHTAVPLKIGSNTIGFLVTGHVALETPSHLGFESIICHLADWGVETNLKELKDAYYQRTVLPPREYAGIVTLLEISGRQLSAFAHRLMQQDAQAEEPMIRRAKAYIAGHHTDPIGLDEIARSMHVSTFYFCKMFKKSTGLTFTDYLSRVRVDKAKDLLMNPRLPVSEIAYMAGFQSLTHFNRLFRRLTGECPTRFRDNNTNRANAVETNFKDGRFASKDIVSLAA